MARIKKRLKKVLGRNRKNIGVNQNVISDAFQSKQWWSYD